MVIFVCALRDTDPPLYEWCWSELLGVWCSNTLLSGAVSEAALICALWNLTSSSTFSLCFFDIRPNLTAAKKRSSLERNFAYNMKLTWNEYFRGVQVHNRKFLEFKSSTGTHRTLELAWATRNLRDTQNFQVIERKLNWNFLLDFFLGSLAFPSTSKCSHTSMVHNELYFFRFSNRPMYF